jgi:hypothetical protein
VQNGPIWDGGTAAQSSEDAHSCRIAGVARPHTYSLVSMFTALSELPWITAIGGLMP